MNTYSDPFPSQEALWQRWCDYLSVIGATTVEPNSGIQVELDEGQLAIVKLSRQELLNYVQAYVNARHDLGLDSGLEAGLPEPLTDSIFELIGSQHPPTATYALQGWAFKMDASE